MEIEDLIDQKSRIKQGIFFTKHHIVNQIITHFDFSNVSTVLDSAAGSCNFLIPLAKKYTNIQFYGVEKNPIIFNEVLREIKDIPNIHYYEGDILLNSFNIPKCDIYLGNPPFINFSDLEEEYRDMIKPIWLNYFPKSRGFRMLLGDSRGDISQLIFALTIDKYLKDDGKIGVILPNSLIKGNSASAGFREFKNITVESLIDISGDDPFDNTARNCFYILGKKGGETTFPINYQTCEKTVKLVKVADDLIEEGTTILKRSDYTARQGVNTLGANKIFIFKTEPPFKCTLLKPLLKSSDIHPYSYNPSYKILFPYKDGKPIEEEELRTNYPETYKYLESFKDTLINRKSRFIQKCWYSLFGVGKYTCTKYKVVWRGLGAKELMAAVTEDVIPNQAMNCYISTETKDEALYICGVMNSQIFKNQLMMLNEEGAKSFAQPNTINKIFIPKYNESILLHKTISKTSLSLHNKFNESEYESNNELVERLYIEEGLISEPKHST